MLADGYVSILLLGGIALMVAVRAAVIPSAPRRTILVGHWGGEEQGLVGSRAFAEDHPEVIQGLQVAFNQDNGTWRIEYLQGQGFLLAGANVARWIAGEGLIGPVDASLGY